MSTTWYPTDDGITIEVADPGDGYLTVVRLVDDPQLPGTDREDEHVLAGTDLGDTLTALTRAATSPATRPGHLTGSGRGDQHEVAGLWTMTATEAAQLLPALQAATIHATAGTARADRVLEPVDPEEPLRPLCSVCGAGNRTATAHPGPHPWCTKHGHTVFGEAPPGRESDPDQWDRAQARYTADRDAAAQLAHLPRRYPG